MIMASLPVFGEITAVVFTANKVPRGAQHPDTISHDRTSLLKVDFVVPFNNASKFLPMQGT